MSQKERIKNPYNENSYFIKKKLDQGGYGTVYQCYDQHDEKFAIKIINLQKMNESQIRVVKNQSKCLKSINHQNFQINREIHMVMEFCQQNLQEYLQGRKLSEQQAMGIFTQIIKGYQQLHKKNIVHRDLKMQNILVSNNKVFKIADFGFAKISQKQTFTTILGTYGHQSAQILQKKAYTSKVDIWALGVMLYQMLFNKRPWNCIGQSKEQYQEIKNNPILSKIEKQSRKISKNIQYLLCKMLQKEQCNRIQWKQLFKIIINKKQSIIQQKQLKIEISTKFQNQNDKQKSIIKSNSHSNKIIQGKSKINSIVNQSISRPEDNYKKSNIASDINYSITAPHLKNDKSRMNNSINYSITAPHLKNDKSRMNNSINYSITAPHLKNDKSQMNDSINYSKTPSNLKNEKSQINTSIRASEFNNQMRDVISNQNTSMKRSDNGKVDMVSNLNAPQLKKKKSFQIDQLKRNSSISVSSLNKSKIKSNHNTNTNKNKPTTERASSTKSFCDVLRSLLPPYAKKQKTQKKQNQIKQTQQKIPKIPKIPKMPQIQTSTQTASVTDINPAGNLSPVANSTCIPVAPSVTPMTPTTLTTPVTPVTPVTPIPPIPPITRVQAVSPACPLNNMNNKNYFQKMIRRMYFLQIALYRGKYQTLIVTQLYKNPLAHQIQQILANFNPTFQKIIKDHLTGVKNL